MIVVARARSDLGYRIRSNSARACATHSWPSDLFPGSFARARQDRIGDLIRPRACTAFSLEDLFTDHFRAGMIRADRVIRFRAQKSPPPLLAWRALALAYLEQTNSRTRKVSLSAFSVAPVIELSMLRWARFVPRTVWMWCAHVFVA